MSSINVKQTDYSQLKMNYAEGINHISDNITLLLEMTTTMSEKNIENGKEKFNLLKNEMKKVGLLNDSDPIIRFEHDDKNKEILAYLNSNSTLANSRPLFKMDLINRTIWEINKINWGGQDAADDTVEDYINSNLDPTDALTQAIVYEWKTLKDMRKNVHTILSIEDVALLGESLKRIAQDITSKGYTVNNKELISIIDLLSHRIEYNLVGSLTDWIPYVKIGLSVDKLSAILNHYNNPEYKKTRNFTTTLETAQTLKSIHPAFTKDLFS